MKAKAPTHRPVFRNMRSVKESVDPGAVTAPSQAKSRDTVMVIAALFCFLLTIFLGLLCYSYPGLQYDEVIFAPAIFIKDWAFFTLNHSIPLMLMSYSGCLKTWLYAPLLHAFQPSVALIRLPALLLAALTVVLTMRLSYVLWGRAAAICAGALLATDSMFLLTSLFDWGPVALQHFLTVLTALLFVRFIQTQRMALLAFAGFVAGLAMWDKALFVWLLSASFAAALLIYPREIRKLVTFHRVSVVVLSFVLGAAPFVYFNVKTGLATFRGNQRDFSQFPMKVSILKNTLNGSGLFGYLVSNEGTGPERRPESSVETASVAVRNWFGTHYRNLFGWLCLVAIAWSTVGLRGDSLRHGVFLFLIFAIAWLEMASTFSTGGAVHHTVLLWPIPHLFVALVAAATLERFSRAVIPLSLVVGIAFSANLLNVNQFLSQFIRFGSLPPWSDAATTLATIAPSIKNGRIAVYEWGLANQIVVMSQGRVKVVNTQGDLSAALSNPDAYSRIRPLIESHVVWAAWTDSRIPIPTASKQANAVMTRAGLHRRDLEIIRDRNGRKMIELFRYDRD
jgi:4-amino-4-deoxy-L-arabinose transferase-like glycosyltransferase